MRGIVTVSILLSLVLSACGGDSSTGPDLNAHVGTYALVTVNGNTLPFTIVQVGVEKIEIVSASINLNADGTYSDRGTLRYTLESGVETEEEVFTGTYTKNGSALSFSDSTGESFNGSLNGDQLTVIAGGFTGVYEK